MTATVALAAAAVMAGAGCKGGGDCAEGSYKSADPELCIKVPDGFKADDKPMKSGDNSYINIRNPKNFHSFTIWVEKKDDLDKRAKAVAGMASSDLKLVASGDVPGRSGKFFHFHNGPGNYDFADVLIAGKDHFYRCEIQNTPADEAKAMVESCKTLSGP